MNTASPTAQTDRKVPAQFAHIKGWGADLDHANRPGYPMERMPARLAGDHSHPPVPQPQTVEILQSIERPSMTPLFGTPQPPSGVSEMLRRAAFKFSESDLRHWMILLFADRVNMVEGLGSDLMRGHVSNLFAEMGGRAKFKHNREAAVQKAVVVSAVAVLSLLLWQRSRNRQTDALDYRQQTGSRLAAEPTHIESILMAHALVHQRHIR